MCGIGGMMKYRIAILNKKNEISCYVDRISFWEKYISNPKTNPKPPTVHVTKDKYKSLTFNSERLADILAEHIHQVHGLYAIIIMDLDV